MNLLPFSCCFLLFSLLVGCDAESTPVASSVSPDPNDIITDVSSVLDTANVDGADGADGPDSETADPPKDEDAGSAAVDTDNPEDISTRPPVAATYDTFIGDWDMQPGQEITKCVLKRLENENEVWVTGITTDLGQGSHHVIVYRSAETEEKTEPFDCFPFLETLGGNTIPLMITQIPQETLEFPDGVAFKFEPNQMVRIEAHYLNYYPEDITAHADVSFHTIDAADVEAEANMLFYGTPDFNIPAGETYDTGWFFLDVWKEAKVFAITGHTHQYGTNVEIKHGLQNEDKIDIYPLDKPFYWDEAPLIQFDPPLSFENGEGFEYRCSWNNTGDKNVTFGESANQEMCFFWAYYYSAPSKGYRMCINPGDIYTQLGDQVCCPDNFLCSLIEEYLAGGGSF
ncbi:MAG: hypothetical protein VX223_06010 [Myxococcota bacterium]|nr:hypothetical protein [Myxococcota bacterium]